MNAARFPAAPPRDKPPPSGNPRAAALDAPPPSRSSPSLLERFRSMLRDREDELRSPGDEEPPPLAAEDVVPLYEEVLSELTVNSKPVITELTIIAGEQRVHAEGIADAICSRILEVPYEQKLPCLYLLDSIVKNIGSEYVRYFQVRLPEVFCEAYNQVPPNFHPAMRHLFGTWTPVFSSSVRRKIQSQLEFASPERQQSSGSGNIRNSESSSPRTGHGIHVNPKYLDARRQFDRPVNPQPWDRDPQVKPSIQDIGGDSSGRDTMERNAAEIPKKWPGASSNYRDVRKQSGTFSGLDSYERKSLPHIGDHDLDQPDIVGQSVSTRRGLVQVGMDAGSSLADSKSNHLRHLTSKASLERLVERNSWQESDPQQTETNISYDSAIELSAMRSRELIDAYGNSKGKSALSVKPPKIQKLEGNRLNSVVAVKDWQNSEEDEYVWEDMSPTLVDRNRSSRLMPRDTNFGNFGSGPRLEKPDSSILGAEFRRNNWSLHRQSLDPSTLPDADRTPSLGVGPGSMYSGSQTNLVPHQLSQYSNEPWKSHYMHRQSSELNLSPRHEEKMQLSFSAADVPLSNHMPAPDYPLKSDARLEKPSHSHSEPMNTDILPPVPSLITVEKVLTQGPTSAHIVPSTVWPSSHKLQQPAPVFVHSQSKQYMERLNNTGTGRLMMNHGVDMPFPAPWQPSETFDRRISSSALPATVLQNPSSVEKSSNQSGVPHLQLPPQQDPQGIHTSRVAPPPPSRLPTQGQVTYHSVAYPNAFSLPQPSLPVPRLPQNPLQVHSGPLPPLPPGPPPTLLQSGTSGSSTSSMSSNAVPSGFSGLINSLVSQGLISLMPQPTSQESLGFDFNPDQLKIRHEPAINDLYVNLPRQCTTCGLRFHCQEEHRSHMDWHVTKNRMSKNRKQKSSRKWFVSSKEWLSGAETLGVDAVPGFLPTETVVDKNEEKDLAVPADEEQNLCALCGEAFEDFYSDEADEWMYKGAVYLNAPEGSVEGLDKFQLGPIVHAKCRTESTEMQGQA